MGLGLVVSHRCSATFTRGINHYFTPAQKLTKFASHLRLTDHLFLQVMTLNPVCENVETAQGVPLTVTGVAQVT